VLACACGDESTRPTAASEPIPISELAEGFYKIYRGYPRDDCELKPRFRKVLSIHLDYRGRVRWRARLREDVLAESVDGWTGATGCLELDLTDTPYDQFERSQLELCPKDGAFIDDDLVLTYGLCPYKVRVDYYGEIDPWPRQGDGQDGGNPQF
jgi:hypothetical protein